ncbi:hypothetical protein [Streptomyces sp. IBSBF 2390]|uniref:hypothetical protein n=1 Tax=Streptomyces sp. IBSBF 2390 TaxID=2903533 RepID=UPI002FDC3F5A
MFSTDPAAAFAHIAAALRPGGRGALLCAAEPEGYQWLSALATLHDLLPTAGFGKPGAPGMFSPAAAGAAAALLREAGLRNVRGEHVTAYSSWLAAHRHRTRRRLISEARRERRRFPQTGRRRVIVAPGPVGSAWAVPP